MKTWESRAQRGRKTSCWRMVLDASFSSWHVGLKWFKVSGAKVNSLLHNRFTFTCTGVTLWKWILYKQRSCTIQRFNEFKINKYLCNHQRAALSGCFLRGFGVWYEWVDTENLILSTPAASGFARGGSIHHANPYLHQQRSKPSVFPCQNGLHRHPLFCFWMKFKWWMLKMIKKIINK